ncbi:MAG TPA: MoaD/ThiS family protein [Methylomirabilota bacterium]|nr:MoaD/ThiS family protein [Methylomirabilota bacterium]
MRVEVRLFATLGRYLPPGTRGDSATLELPAGATVEHVIRELRIPPELECLTVVNGRDAAPAQPLAEGDVVSMFPPLMGGA